MEFYNQQDFDWDRRNKAFEIRLKASEQSRDASYSGDDGQTSNGDEERFPSTLLASFTKGLPHNRDTSLILEPSHFEAFVAAINSGDEDEIAQLPLGPPECEEFSSSMALGAAVRGWESMAAGLAFSLQGPDSHRPAMPPAPQIDSSELAYELTEVYWMALLRDKKFTDFVDDSCDEDIQAAVCSLNAQEWATDPTCGGDLTGDQRRRVLGETSSGRIFRGITTGDLKGPYLSQFLLVGTTGLGGAYDAEEGYISYGSTRIDQRVRVATEGRDYMTTWQAFIDVQNAADVRGMESYADGNIFRFITTPRDLATFVHYDALYQTYLNACLIMLNMKIPFDKGLPFGSPDSVDKQSGFALFGPPHVLALVAEVSTRALKAVRYQKFNNHRRPRPEAVAALVDAFKRQESFQCDDNFESISKLVERVDDDVLERICAHNAVQNEEQVDANGPRSADYDPINGDSAELPTYLLPMAFAEGSPMHPSYGAGHATVAGACVTILKAFFETDTELPFCYVPSEDGLSLMEVELDEPLTVEGELNKVCSNISIGRDWAGVHWFSDYFESIRMGEEVALGLLKEQKLTYGESFSMTVPLFNGSVTEI